METGERREIRPRYGLQGAARWSPDGRRWLMTGADGASRNRLDLIDVRTGETEPLRTFRGDTVCCNWYDWSPDGRTVYYKADLRTGTWLAALEVESGRERILYRVDQPEYIPVWNDVSPDGRELAFWLYQLQERTGRLLVIPTAAPAVAVAPREVLSFKAEGNPPATDAKWTRDGRHLLFIQREDDPAVGRLWRVPAAGGEPEPLGLARNGLGRVPAVHPDGRTVAFAEGQEHTEIWVMENYLPRR